MGNHIGAGLRRRPLPNRARRHLARAPHAAGRHRGDHPSCAPRNGDPRRPAASGAGAGEGRGDARRRVRWPGDLGVGVGWQRGVRRLGRALCRPGRQLDRVLGELRRLWRGEAVLPPAAADGSTETAGAAVWCEPGRCNPAACHCGSAGACTTAPSTAWPASATAGSRGVTSVATSCPDPPRPCRPRRGGWGTVWVRRPGHAAGGGGREWPDRRRPEGRARAGHGRGRRDGLRPVRHVLHRRRHQGEQLSTVVAAFAAATGRVGAVS